MQTAVMKKYSIPYAFPERTGQPNGEFDGICGDCGERMYRYFINNGGHYRYFDRCPECGNEADT